MKEPKSSPTKKPVRWSTEAVKECGRYRMKGTQKAPSPHRKTQARTGSK